MIRRVHRGDRIRSAAALGLVLGLAVPSLAYADGPGAATAKPSYTVDRDKDGVPDNVDACPDTPGVRTNEAKTNGCPNNPWGAPAGASDRDGDRVPDSIDACPDTAGVQQQDPKVNGCPISALSGTVTKPQAQQKPTVVGANPNAPVVAPPVAAPAAVAPPPAAAPAAPAAPVAANVNQNARKSIWYKPWTWFDD